MFRNKIKEVRNLRDLQGQNITSEYACGLYNGLELAMSVLESREPVFQTFESEVKEYKGEEEKPSRTAFSGVRRRGRVYETN